MPSSGAAPSADAPPRPAESLTRSSPPAGAGGGVAVAVAVAQSLRRVRRHVEREGHDYPFLWDVRGEAVRAYESTTTSIVVILDGEGKVAYTGVGPDQNLVAAVTEILAAP